MKNFSTLTVSMILLMLINVHSATAQQVDSAAIFGYNVPTSMPDTAQKKCFLKKLIPHPAFIRLGLTSGAIRPLSGDNELSMSTGGL